MGNWELKMTAKLETFLGEKGSMKSVTFGKAVNSQNDLRVDCCLQSEYQL